MKKEIFNILFLSVVVLVVGWLYWPQNEGVEKQASGQVENFVLAISWQPAFCEGRPNKPECRSQRKGRYDTQNFSLHGLWPQPRSNIYCGLNSSLVKTDKSGRWNQLPKLDLNADTRSELSKYMPGYRSNLHRHEWYKHGVCMGDDATAEEYFEVSIAMLESINSSSLRNLFADNIGKEVTSQQIMQAIQKSFGRGAEAKITVSCKRDGHRTLITELKLSVVLENNSFEGTQNNTWILNAPKLPIGCKRGIVDPVGLQ